LHACLIRIILAIVDARLTLDSQPLTCMRHPPAGILLLRPLLIVNGLRCPTVLRVVFPACARFFSVEVTLSSRML
jgi:hypothetical protein